jgi:hypothetical protein
MTTDDIENTLVALKKLPPFSTSAARPFTNGAIDQVD